MVGCGRPATQALARRIAAVKAAGHPLDPVTVLVPSNAAGLSARRLLATGHAHGLPAVNVANVDFVTPFRLAELVGAADLVGRRSLTNPVLAAAVRATLAASPSRFAAVAHHQATQMAVVALYSELSRALPATRASIAAASARGAEIVRLVAAIEGRLVGFFDEDDLAEAAARRLATDPGAADRLGSFIWHVPERLTPAMTGLVRVALRRARPAATVVALTGEAQADHAVLDTVQRAGVDLGAQPDPPAIAAPSASRLISASDPDEEVRQVVREVIRLVADGTRLDRIAIFRPTPGSYGRTLIEQLDGAGIPHNGPSVTRLADTLVGRTLRAALALRSSGWGRSEVLALVTEAPVALQGGPASLRCWDALSRRAGVVGGLDDWRSKLDQLAQVLAATLAEPESGDPAAGSPRLDSASTDLRATRQLVGFVARLASAVADVDHAVTWARRATAARALVSLLLGSEADRHGWPEPELEAAQQVDAALDRLAVLDDIDPNPSSATFELAVAAELDAAAGRLGRFGHGVLVAPLASSVGLDLDAVFVVGMAEGTCPAFGRDDALLPDVDRERAEAGELVTRDDRLRGQHRSYLAALAAGADHRTLSFPRGDLRSCRERRASRWLLASASKLAGHRVSSRDVSTLPAQVLHTVASYEAGVIHADHHGSVVERDVAALRVSWVAGTDVLGHPLAVGNLGRGLSVRAARSGPHLTEWDGNLAGQPVPSPARGRPMSSTSLETWASCPFRYFLANVLHLGERDDPERVVALSPAEKGTLIHKVLEAFLTEVIDRGAPDPSVAWTSQDRRRIGELAVEAFIEVEARGLTGRPLTWRRTRAEVLADLDVFLSKDDEHRRSRGVRPAEAEMAFGLGDSPPLSLKLPSGRTLTFRGSADRVDRAEDGHLVVLDYKTGSVARYKELADDPVQAGTALQLGVYAEAARASLGADGVESYYWAISGKGEYRQLGYPWSEDRRSRFLDVTEAIVDGIESGLFPAQPGAYDSFWGSHEGCTWCAFDRVCPRDRDDDQRATAGAPELGLLDRLRLPEVAP